ncbi:MAG: Fur family transcriptional regulator [Bacteroidaceae bacterium]
MNELRIKSQERLLAFGIRPSLPRVEVMKYLLEHHTHPNVDTIYKDLLVKIPSLSKTTVYNTVQNLSDKGAVLRITIDNKNVCYDGNAEPHPHFLCKKCGKIYDLKISQEIDIKLDTCEHLIQEVSLYYTGICKDCLDKMSK